MNLMDTLTDEARRAATPDFNQVMPLDLLPADIRSRIQHDVEQDTPPGRYIYVGSPDDPQPLAILPSRSWWEWHWQRGIHPEKKRTALPRYLREFVIARDGLVCGICGAVVPATDVHIDHIKPVSLGGHDVADNLRVTHSRCNLSKGAKF